VILGILAFGAIKGYLRGFIVEIFSFFGFFIGLVLALQLTLPITIRFFSESKYFDLIAVLVFIALFVLLGIGIKAGAKLIKKMVDLTLFGTLDNIVGAVTGIIKWAFLLSVLVWVFDSVGIDFEKRLSSSTVYSHIKQMGPVVFGWLGGFIPFIQDLVDMLKDIPKTKNSYLTFAL